MADDVLSYVKRCGDFNANACSGDGMVEGRYWESVMLGGNKKGGVGRVYEREVSIYMSQTLRQRHRLVTSVNGFIPECFQVQTSALESWQVRTIPPTRSALIHHSRIFSDSGCRHSGRMNGCLAVLYWRPTL